jgi:hypothetical protein
MYSSITMHVLIQVVTVSTRYIVKLFYYYYFPRHQRLMIRYRDATPCAYAVTHARDS